MKSILASTVLAASLMTVPAQEPLKGKHLSLKLESQEVIKRGNEYLLNQQNEKGYWGDPNLPAITGFVIKCLLDDPAYQADQPRPEATKGLEWLLSQQKEDGGIYGRGMATYSTASSIMALWAAGPDKYREEIIKARNFLINHQTDWGVKSENDTKFDGGIGYGGSRAHSDLSNTHRALEALYTTRALATDSGDKKAMELDWEAALAFVSRCQNLQATNKGEKVGNDGSFVYYPGNSKAGEAVDSKTGRVALRGYGSMSYSGLLSLVYADLDASDPRVEAVIDWLSDNYTLEENPGMGGQGLYYYYNAMAKSLVAANLPTLESKSGLDVDWRSELAAAVINNQREDGSWINTKASRWMENDPILVTTYAVMTLEKIHSSFD